MASCHVSSFFFFPLAGKKKDDKKAAGPFLCQAAASRELLGSLAGKQSRPAFFKQRDTLYMLPRQKSAVAAVWTDVFFFFPVFSPNSLRSLSDIGPAKSGSRRINEGLRADETAERGVLPSAKNFVSFLCAAVASQRAEEAPRD